jgi:hypothetical protein
MAEEYKTTWNEITKINIVTFNHKLKFVEHLQKQKLKATKGR